MIIMTPSDELECRNMLYTGHIAQQPAAVRYPRGSGSGIDATGEMEAIEIGKAKKLNDGEKVAILNFGTLMPYAKEAAEALGATLVDMRFAKPLDESMLVELAEQHTLLVSLEDGAIAGGAGSAVAEALFKHKLTPNLLQLGLPDEFVMQGTQQEMYKELKIDTDGIVAQVKDFLA
jgi:1-deoxy-D-xylulose-5-phosphate synthase